jgi:hypothetical protein
MRRGVGVGLVMAALAIASLVSFPRLVTGTANTAFGPSIAFAAFTLPTTSASVGTVGGVCPPGFARCAPVPPAGAPGSVPPVEVLVVMGLAVVAGILHRRSAPTDRRVELPVGIRTAILRPPQPSLLPL